MGSVYLAHELALDRKVAIKVLAPEYASSEELVTRFEREARLLAKIDHPNVVPIIAVGTMDGSLPYIVMKHLEGETLGEYVRFKGDRILGAELVDVMRQ